jgi:hypothetical protein
VPNIRKAQGARLSATSTRRADGAEAGQFSKLNFLSLLIKIKRTRLMSFVLFRDLINV